MAERTASEVADRGDALLHHLQADGPLDRGVLATFIRDASDMLRAQQWRPISEAPKMKTLLLYAATDIGDDGAVKNWRMETGFWHTGYEIDETRSPWEWGGRQLKKYEIQPTKWQPLPAAPQEPR